MKVYTYIRMSLDTGEILEEDSLEYTGEVALCKGGGGGGEPDYEYNRRMATISESELKMAQEYFDFWKTEYKPYEQAQIAANMKMLPYLTEQQISESKYKAAEYEGMLKKDASGVSLLDEQQQTERKRQQQTQQLMGSQTKVAQAAYQAALSGVDENAAANRAKADVTMQYAHSERDMRRDLAREGHRTNTAQVASAMAGLARNRAKDTAGAMTSSRQAAKDEEFKRLYGLSTAKIGGV